MASKLEKYKAAAKRRTANIVAKANESEAATTTGVLAGAAAAGAVSGYGFAIDIGGVDIGIGAPLGAALLFTDGFGAGGIARGAGLGMLAFELGSAVEEMILDMTDDEDDQDEDELSEDDDAMDDENDDSDTY